MESSLQKMRVTTSRGKLYDVEIGNSELRLGQGDAHNGLLTVDYGLSDAGDEAGTQLTRRA